MKANRISKIRTTELVSDAGRQVALFLSLNCDDPDTLDSFCAEVARMFMIHRWISPPETSVLLVTLIGCLSAHQFARRWREIAESDPLLRYEMSLLRIADVVHGTADGQVFETVSLLSDDVGHELHG